MVNSRSRKIASITTVGGLSIAMAVALGPMANAAPAEHPTSVPTGVTAGSLPQSAVFGGGTDPNTPERVSFVLKMRGMPSLSRKVERGMHRHLTVHEFARRYGQHQRRIRQLTDYLHKFGITTKVYPNRINISARGTAGEFNKALSVTQHNYKMPAQRSTHGHPRKPPQRIHVPNRNPLLPHRLASMVTAILGLSNYAPFSTQSVHVKPQLKTAQRTKAAQNCIDPTATATMCNLPTDFAQRYKLNGLYKKGYDGSGQTIGIVTLAAYNKGSAEAFWQRAMHLPKTGRTVTVQNIDGGPGAPNEKAGSGETDLDVQQAGGVAPGADVIVYQAPNTDSGWIDAFFTAASQNKASTISSSWGESETIVRAAIASGVEAPAIQKAYDEAFLELAAQGQSTFLSSGDSGAYSASADLGSTDVSAGAIASSPYITSSGGTTLPWSGAFKGADGNLIPVSVKHERAWGWDYLWPAIAGINGTTEAEAAVKNTVGGGGGYSVLERRPSYQNGIWSISRYSAVEHLTPTNFVKVTLSTQGGITVPTSWKFTADPKVSHGRHGGRMQPDVSADADPETGYLRYDPEAAAGKQWQAGWGGTSFVAPQFNGSAAVMNEALGHRVGLWNPAMYRLAESRYSPVTPLSKAGTDNDNLYFTGTPGTLYNPATGLGIPDLTQFASQLKGHHHWR